MRALAQHGVKMSSKENWEKYIDTKIKIQKYKITFTQHGVERSGKEGGEKSSAENNVGEDLQGKDDTLRHNRPMLYFQQN